ncbi:MAG: stage V sporulation protein AA [Clostridia bacterium]
MPQTQTIYVKAKKQAKIVRKRQITVGDVADLEGDPVLVSKIKDLTVTQLKAKGEAFGSDYDPGHRQNHSPEYGKCVRRQRGGQ